MTRPCAECPFTRGADAVRLRSGRVREIAGNMLRSDGGDFPCHKTLDKPHTEHCVGALIFAEKHGACTQMMRVLGRIGLYDPRRLRGHETVFDSLDEMLRTALDRRTKRKV
jgi:hypothetical protein